MRRHEGLWFPIQLLRGLPSGVQLRLPLGRFVFLVRGLVELHQPLQSFGQADLAWCGDLRLALAHPFVALQEERLGVSIQARSASTGFVICTLACAAGLFQERAAQQRLRAERRPGVGLLFLTDGQSLAHDRFRLHWLPGLQQCQA